MSDPQSIQLTLTTEEIQVVRTALRLLVSALGREEADELAAAQAILARIEAGDR